MSWSCCSGVSIALSRQQLFIIAVGSIQSFVLVSSTRL